MVLKFKMKRLTLFSPSAAMPNHSHLCLFSIKPKQSSLISCSVFLPLTFSSYFFLLLLFVRLFLLFHIYVLYTFLFCFAISVFEFNRKFNIRLKQNSHLLDGIMRWRCRVCWGNGTLHRWINAKRQTRKYYVDAYRFVFKPNGYRRNIFSTFTYTTRTRIHTNWFLSLFYSLSVSQSFFFCVTLCHKHKHTHSSKIDKSTWKIVSVCYPLNLCLMNLWNVLTEWLYNFKSLIKLKLLMNRKEKQ